MSKNVKLVLSGSGLLYPVQVGAVVRLAEEGYEFTEILGTSGGSIVGAMLASGYKPNQELIDLVKKTVPSKNKLIDFSLWSLVTKWGLCDGKKVEEMLRKYLVKNFKDVKIPLHIATANLEREMLKVFNNKNDPDMDLVTAVRASMSIPGAFTPVMIAGELHVDGGLTGNFAIDYFGDVDNVIGIKFKSSYGVFQKIRNVVDYVMACINTMIEGNVVEKIEDAPKAKTILLKSKYKSLNFNATEKDFIEMMKEGSDSVEVWLQANEPVKIIERAPAVIVAPVVEKKIKLSPLSKKR